MKKIQWTFILMLLLGCLSCCKHTNSSLSKAEAFIWAHPDSALQILESIPATEKLKGQDRANYALLMSLAQYRCYLPISSDSLINIALEYYGDGNDWDKRATAWYVKGGIFEEDIPQSLLAYKQAETCIPHVKDKHLIAHIYSSLGYLNSSSYNLEQAKDYFKKALSINKTINNTNSQISNLLNLATVYVATNQEDSAGWYMDELLCLGTSATDSVLLAKIYHNAAIWNIQKEDYMKAEKYLILAIRTTFGQASYKNLIGLAELYNRKGLKEKADSLYQEALHGSDLSVRASIYDNLYRETLAEKRYKEASDYANLYIAVADSFYNDNFHKEVMKIQKEYDRVELLYENSKLENRWLISLFMIVFIIGASLCIFKIYQRKLNRLSIEQVQVNMAYKKERQELLNQIDSALQKKKEQEAAYNRMKLLYGVKGDTLTSTDVSALLVARSLFQNRKCDLTIDRNSLKHWLNLSRDGFANRFSDAYPMLTEHFLDVCCLSALGLSIDEIAQILSVNVRTVERYMGQICIEVNFALRGKKGFVAFMNATLSVKP